jgi:hypothetical protein
MNDTPPNMGDTVTLPDYTEKLMVKSVSDGRTVDLMTLTKRPVPLKDVARHNVTMVKPASNA